MSQKLIPKTLEVVLRKFPLLSQVRSTEPVILIEFFTPNGPFTWFVLGAEGRPGRDWRFIGLMETAAGILVGLFDLLEIKEFGDEFGRRFFLGLERDSFYDGRTTPLKEELRSLWTSLAPRCPTGGSGPSLMEGFIGELKAQHPGGITASAIIGDRQ